MQLKHILYHATLQYNFISLRKASMMFHYKLFKLLVICTLFGNSSNCAENHLKQSIPESVSKPADIIQHMQNLARYLVRELSPEAYTYNGNEHYALMNIHFGRLVQAQSTERLQSESSPMVRTDRSCVSGSPG